MTRSEPSLAERLMSRDYKTVSEAIREAVQKGEVGEAEIVRRIEAGPPRDLAVLVAALGDSRGARGPAALRLILSDSTAGRDIRCAAVLALAKRCGSDASGDLVSALEAKDSVLKEYAIASLAAVGDSRAWDAVFHRLKQVLARRSRDYVTLDPTDTELCASYLGRHLDNDGPRRDRVVTLVRRRWGNIHSVEQRWFHRYWPECDPTIGPSQPTQFPSPDKLSEWARKTVLLPAFVDSSDA